MELINIIKGDIPESRQHFKFTQYAQNFLKEAVQIAPILFSAGNHELYLNQEDRGFLSDLGVIFLDDSFCTFGDLIFGGLSSSYKYLANTGISSAKEEHRTKWEIVFSKVNTDWLDEFEQQAGYKLLLCHHPEFYEHFLCGRKIDLILAGHAHGGQIRLFGKAYMHMGRDGFQSTQVGFTMANSLSHVAWQTLPVFLAYLTQLSWYI